MTCQDLPDPGVNSVGLMTTLQGTRKWVGLGKQGETFVANMFNMVQPVLPAHHRAILSLSWMQYKKLKVGVSLSDFWKKKALKVSLFSSKKKFVLIYFSVFVCVYVRSCAACVVATKSVSVLRARAASGLQSSCSKNPTTAPRWCCGGSTATWSGCWATSTRLAKSSRQPQRWGEPQG